MLQSLHACAWACIYVRECLTVQRCVFPIKAWNGGKIQLNLGSWWGRNGCYSLNVLLTHSHSDYLYMMSLTRYVFDEMENMPSTCNVLKPQKLSNMHFFQCFKNYFMDLISAVCWGLMCTRQCSNVNKQPIIVDNEALFCWFWSCITNYVEDFWTI